MSTVSTTGLTKRYGDQLAVDAVDLSVPTGAVYGFLGPNGSGKTTTIRMLLGLVAATAGEIEMLGLPMPARSDDVLPRVGALVEGPAFHPYFSGRDNLRRLDAADTHTDAATSRQRIAQAFERVGLQAAATKRFREYSLGMKQRLAIAAALLTPRELLVLDEPTNGLDPQGTREVRALVSELAADGITVLISSHLLSEIEQICSHVGVMATGRLVAQGTVGDLQAGREPIARVQTSEPEAAARVLTDLGLTEVRRNGAWVSGELGMVASEKVVAACVHAGIPVLGFAVAQPSLEDVFVALTGEGFDVSG